MTRGSLHWSESDALKAQLKGARATLTGQGQVKRSKYGNTRVAFQGQVFDSKKELKQWKWFEQQRLLGAIRGVARQVSMPMAGSRRRIRIDFMVVANDGAIRWLDSKGFETQTSRLKRQQIFDAYGIQIEIC